MARGKTTSLEARSVAPRRRAHRRPSPEDLAGQVLQRFDALRDIAATLPEAMAEQVSDQAWTLVEQAEPVRVQYAAELLGVSGPTVRSWIEHGVLRAASVETGGRGPRRVTLDSLAEAKEITDELRAAGQDRRLIVAVISRLEGDELARNDRLRTSVKQMHRGRRGQWPGAGV